MKEEVSFYINNQFYTVSVEEEVKEHLLKFLDPSNEDYEEKHLLGACVQMAQVHIDLIEHIKKLSSKLDKFE